MMIRFLWVSFFCIHAAVVGAASVQMAFEHKVACLIGFAFAFGFAACAKYELDGKLDELLRKLIS
jgi:hypothetical protein